MVVVGRLVGQAQRCHLRGDNQIGRNGKAVFDPGILFPDREKLPLHKGFRRTRGRWQ